VLLCYNYQNGLTNEEEDIIFATEPKLFSIGTINLLKTIQSMKTIDVEIMDNNVKTNNSEFKFGVQSTEKKITSNKYEPKVALKDKVYPDTYYNHQPWNVAMDEILGKIKAQELQIVGWMLMED
jgi:hypothetical protein